VHKTGEEKYILISGTEFMPRYLPKSQIFGFWMESKIILKDSFILFFLKIALNQITLKKNIT